ncbi:MAG: serine--tRNA ligase [Flavobacteriaceae bacterium]|nr:serine--tRNA ligase [Flavobacteriaceae bacterium]|tara:strand:+ start:6322 stop:7590 length:1269 start_codon:yes stop_codon:yes gene_type:complete
MLGLAYIRENKDSIIEGLSKRNFDAETLINQIIQLDILKRSEQTKLERQLAEGNKIAKNIASLFKSGDNEAANKLKNESASIKLKTKKFQEKLNEIEKKLFSLQTQIPNVPDKSVQKGISEKDNQEVYRNKKEINLPKNFLSHWELAKKYNIIDFELGNKITGSGFPVYKGKGARLQRGLIQFFLDKNISAGYEEYQVPLLVNYDSGYGTGQLPDKDGQMYHSELSDLYLIPTAEVPLTNLYRNVLLNENDLPICMTAYTPCFRREAGSYGSDVRGLNRLHQFDKVEIVRLETPQKAMSALDEMVNHVKNILSDLELPYRILKLCGADLGFTSALTYDFEIYSAAQNKWLEVSSVSIFNSFQAERLKLRFKSNKGVKKPVYTLNGSALALPRVLAGLLENFQSENKIKIPKTLIPYVGFDSI